MDVISDPPRYLDGHFHVAHAVPCNAVQDIAGFLINYFGIDPCVGLLVQSKPDGDLRDIARQVTCPVDDFIRSFLVENNSAGINFYGRIRIKIISDGDVFHIRDRVTDKDFNIFRTLYDRRPYVSCYGERNINYGHVSGCIRYACLGGKITAPCVIRYLFPLNDRVIKVVNILNAVFYRREGISRIELLGYSLCYRSSRIYDLKNARKMTAVKSNGKSYGLGDRVINRRKIQIGIYILRESRLAFDIHAKVGSLSCFYRVLAHEHGSILVVDGDRQAFNAEDNKQ